MANAVPARQSTQVNQNSSLSDQLASLKPNVYAELALENWTGSDLYVLDSNGEVRKIPTKCVDFGGQHRRGIELYRMLRSSTDVLANGITNKNIEDKSNRTKECIFYPADLLSGVVKDGLCTNPVLYLSELNATVSLSNDITRLRNEHPCFKKPADQPVTITANCHDLSLTKIYYVVNDRIVTVPVTHNVSINEYVSYHIDSAIPEIASNTRAFSQISGELFAQDIVYNPSSNMLFGKSFKAVQDKLLEIRRKTSQELSLSQQREISEKESIIKELTEKLERCKQENAKLKENVSYFEQQQQHIRDKSLAEIQFETQKLKSESDQQNIERMAAAEEAKYKNILAKQEADAQKMHYDNELQSLKIQQEQMAARTANMSATASMTKSLATMAPIAVAAIVWAKGTAAATASGLVAAGALAATAPVTLVAGALIAVSVLAISVAANDELRQKLVNGLVSTKEALTIIKDKVIAGIKTTAAAICRSGECTYNFVKNLIVKVTSVAKSGLCKLGSAVKSVFNSTISAVKSAVAKVGEIAANVAEKAKAVAECIWDKTKSAASAVWDGCKHVASKVGDFCSDAYNTASSIITNTKDKICSWFF